MIQRIQSVYLLLASLAIYALFVFPLATVFEVDGAKKINIMGVYQGVDGSMVQTESFLLLTIAAVLVGAFPLALVFLYKNRKKQMIYTYIIAFVVILFSYWISVVLKGSISANMQASDYGIGIGLSSISVFFLVMAARAINRDEKLVKSADRLR